MSSLKVPSLCVKCLYCAHDRILSRIRCRQCLLNSLVVLPGWSSFLILIPAYVVQIFIYDATFVTPLPLLLFAGKVEFDKVRSVLQVVSQNYQTECGWDLRNPPVLVFLLLF